MKPNTLTNNKSNKTSFQVDRRTVTFTGDFDSGNLEKVQQVYSNPKDYRIWAGFDDPNQECSSKTFFHFRVQGFQSVKIKFRIVNLSILSPLARSDKLFLYRPVYKTNTMSEYERIPSYPIAPKTQKIQIHFDFAFKQEEYVYFAFCYPYSYERSQLLTQNLYNQLNLDDEIYYHKQILTVSNQQRNVYLITVTDRKNCLKADDDICKGLFPFAYDKRALKIKPIPRIMITARVHPGQSPSSYCFEGLLKFLTDKTDYRAHLLRKKFHFVLIPMLNPDGVYHGMFRWDPVTKQDLNRTYTKCTQKDEPTIWAVKQFIQKVIKGVDFYFDLHGHSSLKNFFVYGNAFDDVIKQTQTQVFTKLLSINSPFFSLQSCNFSKNDYEKKTEDSKEGCARFYLMKKYRIIHSFTIQCGYHSPDIFNLISNPQNKQIIYQGLFRMNQDDTQIVKPQFYSIKSYMNFGKCVLISILDTIECNPYTRVACSEQKSLMQIRNSIGQNLYKTQDRLRMSDPFILKNLKNLHQLCLKYYKDMADKLRTHKSLPKLKIVRNKNPIINQSIGNIEFSKVKRNQRFFDPKPTASNYNTKQFQISQQKKPPETQIINSSRQISISSFGKLSNRLPSKTVQTERLISRMKKIQQIRNYDRRQVDSFKLLPIKQSQYLLQIIKQRLEVSTSIHRGYVPSLPQIKGKSKPKKQILRFVKKTKNSSPFLF